MLTLRPGSQAFLLVSLLAVTGEFPLRSLHLLGNERVLRELVRSGSGRQVIRNSNGSAQVDTRLFQISGRGRDKSLRLYKGALPVLDWLIRQRTGTTWTRSTDTVFRATAPTASAITASPRPPPCSCVPAWR